MAQETDFNYFDDPIEFTSPKTSPKTSPVDKLKQLFPSRISHMRALINLYKYCFRKDTITKIPIMEQTKMDVINDIANTPISLDIGSVIQENEEAIKNFYNNEVNFNKKLSNIPIFINFAYLYYVWHYDPTAPFYKLPSTILKFNLISDALQTPKDKLHENFVQCIHDDFIRDLRIEQPPFIMRTDLTIPEIKEKINMNVAPICKEILNGLFKLNKHIPIVELTHSEYATHHNINEIAEILPTDNTPSHS